MAVLRDADLRQAEGFGIGDASRRDQQPLRLQLDRLAAERRRLEKDLAAAQKELSGTTAKLSNEGFLAKAPAEVVDKIKSRRQVAGEEVERITARLDALPRP